MSWFLHFDIQGRFLSFSIRLSFDYQFVGRVLQAVYVESVIKESHSAGSLLDVIMVECFL